MDKKLDFLTKDLVDKAALEIDKNGIPSSRGGTDYAVNIGDKQYPYKLLATEAAKLADINLTSNDFSSNANNRLGFEKLTGYTITNLKEKMAYFNLNNLFNYKNEVGKKYNSDSQGAKTYFDTRSKLQYLGEQLGESLGLTLVNNYNEKPNKMAGKGKGFVLKEYILTGFLPLKYKNLGNSIFMKLSFHNLDSTPIFGLDIDVNFSDGNNKFNKMRDELQKQASWSIPVDNSFPRDWDSLLEIIIPVFTTQLNYIETFLSNKKKMIEIDKYIDLLKYKYQIIMQGPPGTGKTYTAKDIAEQMITGVVSANKKEQALKLKNSDQYVLVQFHPSYTYEDFVRGITAKVDEKGNINYNTENKILADLAEKAKSSDKPFVLIIDEINRANLPSVLGELIYALEYRGESIESMYGIGDNRDRSITIPKNLFVIGTMNTADRSVGHIDYAIKRRFAFIDVLPDEEVITNERAKILFNKVALLFTEEFLASDFKKNDVQIGHSYFILKEGTEEEQEEELQMRLTYEIVPILKEYVKDGLLLENARKEITKIAEFV